MYIPKHFLCSDVATLMELWRLNPLIDLVTVREGKPHVSPLPVLIEHRNDHVIIRGHWARANPQWQHPSNATAIFHGPNHYISPSWYPDKTSMTRVPTWNYVQAVLTGDMHIFLDEAQLADLVTAMSTNFEPQFGGDWQFNRNDPKELAQLRGIVGFELTVDTIQIKSKLSQNHPQTNRDSVASNLRNLNRPNALSLAQWMQNQISELQ